MTRSALHKNLLRGGNTAAFLAFLILIFSAGAVFAQAQPFYSESSPGAAASEVRFQQLEAQIRELTGKIEEQSFYIKQLQEQLDRRVGDMEMRMNEMGGMSSGMPPQPQPGMAPAAGAQQTPSATPYYNPPAGNVMPPPPQQQGNSSFQYQGPEGSDPNLHDSGATKGGQLGTLTTAPGSGPVADNAASAYEHAFAQLKANNIPAAEAEFSQFLQQYPNHALVSNAKYWYGETFYVSGKYEDAARVFAEGYQAYPKGQKAPDNLLKLGLSLAALGKKEDACIALGQLGVEYGTTAGPVVRRAGQEMSRLGCS